MTKVSREIALLRALLRERLPVASNLTQVLYQAAGAESGLIVTMDVYRPNYTKDVDQSGLANEIGTTGRYYMSFAADAPGWFVLIHDNVGGTAVKQF